MFTLHYPHAKITRILEVEEETMARYRFTDGKSITASSPEDFVRVMRETSWCPGTDVDNFMTLCSERGEKIGFDIRCDSAYNFLSDLIKVGIVAIEAETVWN